MAPSDHVVLCGRNELALGVLSELRGLGEEVVVATDTPEGDLAERARALGAELSRGTRVARPSSAPRAPGRPPAWSGSTTTTTRATCMPRWSRVRRGVRRRPPRRGTAGRRPRSGRGRRFRRPHWRRARALVAAADRRLAHALVAVLALIALIAVFAWFAGLSVLDALYFATATLTSTGYGDIHSRDADAPLKLYVILLMLLGTATLAVVFALITDAIVRARLARALGDLPADLHDHVVVCGVGKIGLRVVQELARLDLPVVAVDADEDESFLPAVRRAGVATVIGDVRLEETLGGLQLQGARCLAIFTGDDLVSLEAGLTARAAAPDLRIVVRVFDPDFAVRIERAFGIEISRSPIALAAPAFAAAAEGENVLAAENALRPGRRRSHGHRRRQLEHLELDGAG